MSINRGMDNDVVHIICTMDYYLALKENEMMPFAATWIDTEIIILSEVSQRGKILYDVHYMGNLKINDTNELIYKTETGL